MYINNEEVTKVDVLDDIFTSKIADNLDSQGVDVSSLIVELVVREYLKEKKELLSNDISVIEEGIGTSYSGYRLLREGLSDRKFTPFVRYALDEDLKDTLLDYYEDQAVAELEDK